MNTIEKVQYYGTGKRKTSTARVFLMPGTGQFVVNHADYQEYFPGQTQQKTVEEALQETGLSEKFDVYVNVKGGGMTGQAGAIRMGLARALLDFDPETSTPAEEGWLSQKGSSNEGTEEVRSAWGQEAVSIL